MGHEPRPPLPGAFTDGVEGIEEDNGDPGPEHAQAAPPERRRPFAPGPAPARHGLEGVRPPLLPRGLDRGRVGRAASRRAPRARATLAGGRLGAPPPDLG